MLVFRLTDVVWPHSSARFFWRARARPAHIATMHASTLAVSTKLASTPRFGSVASGRPLPGPRRASDRAAAVGSHLPPRPRRCSGRTTSARQALLRA